jgi:hypothetical protein
MRQPTARIARFLPRDYRFADNAQDYILNSWAAVDLSPLGDWREALRFSLARRTTAASA